MCDAFVRLCLQASSHLHSGDSQTDAPNININIHADSVNRSTDDYKRMEDELILLREHIRQNRAGLHRILGDRDKLNRGVSFTDLPKTCTEIHQEVRNTLEYGNVDMERFDVVVDASILEKHNSIKLDFIPNGCKSKGPDSPNNFTIRTDGKKIPLPPTPPSKRRKSV